MRIRPSLYRISLTLMCCLVIYAVFQNGVQPVVSASRNLQQQTKIFAADGSSADYYGWSVDVSDDGNTLIVGAYADTVDATLEGSAYIYRRNGANWTQQTQLHSASPVADQSRFGSAVALSADGNLAVVGAPESIIGGVFVYRYVGSNWVEEVVLSSNDVAGGIGESVAVNDAGNMIFAASRGDIFNPGAVVVFLYDGTEWTQSQVLTASDSEDHNDLGIDLFLDNDTLLVGAGYGNGLVDDTGAVYVFKNIAGVWTETAKLTANDGAALDYFSYPTISGNTIMVGAPGDDSAKGAVYVFTYNGTTWAQTQKLTASNAAANSSFGNVEFAGPKAIITAPQANNFTGQGYVFEFNGTNWVETQKFKHNDNTTSIAFGFSIAADAVGKDVFIGAFFGTGIAAGTGAVYMFTDDEVSTATPTPSATSSPAITSTPTATVSPTSTQPSTATPVASVTSTSTISASVTPTATAAQATATATEIARAELLINGGFENDSNADKIPDNWTQKNPTADTLKCNKDTNNDGIPDKIFAFEGNCAYRFKNAPAENSKLIQIVDLTGITLTNGDTLALALQGFARGIVNTKAKLVIGYVDTNVPAGKLTLAITAAQGYQLFTGEVILSDIPASIKLTLQNKGTSGKVDLDAVSLTVEQQSSVLPLP